MGKRIIRYERKLEDRVRSWKDADFLLYVKVRYKSMDGLVEKTKEEVEYFCR